jgi:hypothetical protein
MAGGAPDPGWIERGVARHAARRRGRVGVGQGGRKFVSRLRRVRGKLCTSRGEGDDESSGQTGSPRVASGAPRIWRKIERGRTGVSDGCRILHRPISHRCACLSGTPVAHHPVKPRLVAILRSPDATCRRATSAACGGLSKSKRPPCVPLNPRFLP